jgi:hypothetical protein
MNRLALGAFTFAASAAWLWAVGNSLYVYLVLREMLAAGEGRAEK